MHLDAPPDVVQTPPVFRQFAQNVPPEPPVPTQSPLWQTIELGHDPHATCPPQPSDQVPHPLAMPLHVAGTHGGMQSPSSPHVPPPAHGCP